MLVAKGERLYATSLGEKRDYIAKILAQFDSILERQNPTEIKKNRQKLQEILDQIDGEEWF
jgi:molecular chaperone HscC